MVEMADLRARSLRHPFSSNDVRTCGTAKLQGIDSGFQGAGFEAVCVASAIYAAQVWGGSDVRFPFESHGGVLENFSDWGEGFRYAVVKKKIDEWILVNSLVLFALGWCCFGLSTFNVRLWAAAYTPGETGGGRSAPPHWQPMEYSGIGCQCGGPLPRADFYRRIFTLPLKSPGSNDKPALVKFMLKQSISILSLSYLATTVTLHAHFFWKVETEIPSYIYGTIHSSDPLVRSLPADIYVELGRAKSFHPELAFSPENIGRLAAAIFAHPGGDLEVDLPPPLWARLIAIGKQAGIPEFMMRRVPLSLAPLLFASAPGAEFNQIIDIQLYQYAKDNEITIHPLETVDEQIAVFSGLDQEQGISLLKGALDEFEAGFPSQTQIIQLYAAGDFDQLQQFVEQEMARSDQTTFIEQLLHQRNKRMTDRVLPFLETGGAFIAVGAAHMVGPGGIIQRAQTAGYQIKRIQWTDQNDPPATR